MESPRFSLKGTLPSLYKSALISIGGVGLSLLALAGLKFYFQGQDFSTVDATIATAASAWIVNLVYKFISEEK